jgi:phage major head subunit gpT-like protein
VDLNGSPNNFSITPHEDDVCVRCGGLMVVEHYIDLQDDTGQIGLTAWRCMSCGEVIDPIILQNRERPAPNLLYGTKQRKYAQPVDQVEAESSGSREGDDRGGASRQN